MGALIICTQIWLWLEWNWKLKLICLPLSCDHQSVEFSLATAIPIHSLKLSTTSLMTAKRSSYRSITTSGEWAQFAATKLLCFLSRTVFLSHSNLLLFSALLLCSCLKSNYKWWFTSESVLFIALTTSVSALYTLSRVNVIHFNRCRGKLGRWMGANGCCWWWRWWWLQSLIDAHDACPLFTLQTSKDAERVCKLTTREMTERESVKETTSPSHITHTLSLVVLFRSFAALLLHHCGNRICQTVSVDKWHIFN